MGTRKEELQLARTHFRKLDAEYLEEQKQAQAAREIGLKRRLEDGRKWEELLSASGIEPAKFREHEKADAQRAAEIRNDVVKRLSPVPPAILSSARDSILVNQNAGLVQVAPPGTQSFVLQFVDRSTMGNCGSDAGDVVFPRAETVGSGSGWLDSHTDQAQCGLWFAILWLDLPGGPSNRLSISVCPFLDMHGFYWVRSDDGIFTSKQAETKFSIFTRISQFTLSNSFWSSWVVLDRNSDNIDEEGRIDFTGYATNAKGQAVILGGATVQIEVIAEAYCYSQGSGSHAIMDFQTGNGDGVRIPWVSAEVVDLGTVAATTL